MKKFYFTGLLHIFARLWQVKSMHDWSHSVKNHSVSNDSTPFQPFHDDRFSYSGSYNPQQRLEYGTEVWINAGMWNFSTRPYTLPVPKGGNITEYTGGLSKIKVVFEWLMEGAVWSYGESTDALHALEKAVKEQIGLDYHPMQVTLSQGGHRQIRYTVAIDPGENVRLNTTGRLHFNGAIWLDRRLYSSGKGRSVFDAMIADVQHHEAASRVPYNYHFVPRAIDVLGTVGFYAFEAPPFTFGELLQLFEVVQEFYEQHDYATMLAGHIFIGPQEIGWITILNADSENLLPNIATSQGSYMSSKD